MADEVKPQPQEPVTTPAPEPTNVTANELDVNKLITEIEEDTKRRESELKDKIMKEAESKFTGEFGKYKEESKKTIDELNSKIEALQKAAKQQTEEVVNEYKTKLAEQAAKLQNIEGELSKRTTTIPQENNPFRKEVNNTQSVDLVDRKDLSEDEKLDLFFKSLAKR